MADCGTMVETSRLPELVDLYSKVQETLELARTVFSDLDAANGRMFGEPPESKTDAEVHAVQSGQLASLMNQADTLRGIMGNIAGAANRLCGVV